MGEQEKYTGMEYRRIKGESEIEIGREPEREE